MTSNKFIKVKIQKLLKLIPKLEIYYEYDDFSESHFLKVLPLNEFQNNAIYINFENEFNNEFFTHYPFELLTFLSEEDVYEMKNAERYISENHIIIPNSFSNANFDFRIAIENLLIEYNVEMPKSIDFSAFFNAAKYKNTYDDVLLYHKNTENKKTPTPISIATESSIDLTGKNDETNISTNLDYSLAA